MIKFYSDSMLGKLSRFLRFFGFDTLYRSQESVEEMLQTSLKENRIVLSQARQVIQQCNKQEIQAVAMPTSSIVDQLVVLKTQLKLEYILPPPHLRCSMCNGDLEEKAKDEVSDKIPEGTSKYYEEFWECKDCGKVYWLGSHWEDIKKIIKEVELR
ncbi:MAG: Mut7-C RNAse domain-containing protein [Candidatus Heimdallarchaeaceae archaeon]|jgi:uncharacterized protein with PIN domain